MMYRSDFGHVRKDVRVDVENQGFGKETRI